MISVCPACNRQINVPPTALGKQVRCSGCQAVFVVPSVSSQSVASAPPPPAPAAPSMFSFEEPDPPYVEDEPPVEPNVLDLQSGAGRPLGNSVGVVIVGILLTLIVAGVLGIGTINSRGTDQVIFGAMAAVLGLLTIAMGVGIGCFLGFRSLTFGIATGIASALSGLLGLGGVVIAMFTLAHAHQRGRILLIGFACFCSVQGLVCIGGGAVMIWNACRAPARELLAKHRR